MLGQWHTDQGMHDDAVRLFEEAVETDKRVLGPEHVNRLVLTSRKKREPWQG